MKNTLKILVAFTLAFIGSAASLLSFDTANGFSTISLIAQIVADMFFLLTVALTMLLGMFANSVHSKIKSLPPGSDQIELNEVLGDSLRSSGFWLAIIISPIVFATVYLLVREQPDPVVSYLLAFENGFFWKAVFDARTPHPP